MNIIQSSCVDYLSSQGVIAVTPVMLTSLLMFACIVGAVIAGSLVNFFWSNK
jgi:hypothetical protein